MTTPVKELKPATLKEYFAQSHAHALVLLAERGTFGTQAYRCAFDATHQPFGPFSTPDETALTTLVLEFLAYTRTVLVHEEGNFSQALLPIAAGCARGLHSHSGKYVKPEASARRLVRPGSAPETYLTSRSAGPQRWMSGVFSHMTSATRPARIFMANFTHNERITSVAELLSENNETVKLALITGEVASDVVEALVDTFHRVFQNQTAIPDPKLKQLLWPQEGGTYLALTGLPALSVYNALKAMRSAVPVEHWLPLSSYSAGSGKSQNVSVAATSTSGHIPMLVCLPPRIRHTSIGRLLRLALGNRLVVRFSFKFLKTFSADVSALPNQARSRFYQVHARSHANYALSRVIELREALTAEVFEVDAIPVLLAKTLRTVITQDVQVTADDVEELEKLVLEAGVAKVLVNHPDSGISTYREHLRSAIASLI